MPTLDEIVKEKNLERLKGFLTDLTNELDDKKDSEIKKIADLFYSLHESILDGQKQSRQQGESILKALASILDKELPDYPTSMKISNPVKEISIQKPDWYHPISLQSIETALTKESIKAYSESTKTNKLLTAILNALETKEVEPIDEKEPGAIVQRMKSRPRWVKYLSTDGTITGALDGVNLTYYLPSGLIVNSETIRLNQGVPLSSGIDYTMNANGNRIDFILGPTGIMEVRGQTR